MIDNIECISCQCTLNLKVKNGISICDKCLSINSDFLIKYEKEKVKFYPEINLITNNLFLGNYDAARSKDLLIENQITHVLTCGKDMEFPFKNDFINLQIDIEDIIEENI